MERSKRARTALIMLIPPSCVPRDAPSKTHLTASSAVGQPLPRRLSLTICAHAGNYGACETELHARRMSRVCFTQIMQTVVRLFVTYKYSSNCRVYVEGYSKRDKGGSPEHSILTNAMLAAARVCFESNRSTLRALSLSSGSHLVAAVLAACSSCQLHLFRCSPTYNPADTSMRSMQRPGRVSDR